MQIEAVPRVLQYPMVRDYMTPAPHTVARTRSLSVASRLMRDHQVRHLPVLEDGRIVGVVSQRDILLIESLPAVNPTDVRVEEAMIVDVVTATPETPIGEAIEAMIDRKVGSVIVSEGDHVLGVFTTIDALRALHDLLKSP